MLRVGDTQLCSPQQGPTACILKEDPTRAATLWQEVRKSVPRAAGRPVGREGLPPGSQHPWVSQASTCTRAWATQLSGALLCTRGTVHHVKCCVGYFTRKTKTTFHPTMNLQPCFHHTRVSPVRLQKPLGISLGRCDSGFRASAQCNSENVRNF